MISAAVIDRWLAHHSHRSVTIGPAGTARMGVSGEDRFRVVAVPELRWGRLTFDGAAFVERAAGTFEEWLSQMTATPVVGALGGNVLRELRIDIDYPAERVAITRARAKARSSRSART